MHFFILSLEKVNSRGNEPIESIIMINDCFKLGCYKIRMKICNIPTQPIISQDYFL